jgi:hypothetical protein
MWFGSGMIMIYVPFPSLSEQERLSYLEPVDTTGIRTEPGEAVSFCPSEDLSGLRLISISQRPAFVCHNASAPVAAIFADDGASFSPNDLASDELLGPFDYDQWVVHQRFDPYRPFYRQDLDDEAGTQLYISSLTGEVLQRTTSQQRVWNYFGAVVHWIYPTILRKDWALWDKTVWWVSLAGITGVLIGLYLGVVAFLRNHRSNHKGISPYRAWLRWHHILGLFTGTFILTWIFSGWLSMDHGRLFSTPDPTAIQVAAFRGKTFNEIASESSITDLTTISFAKEISFHAVAGQIIVLSKDNGNKPNMANVSESELRDGTRLAWPDAEIADISVISDDDIYTSLREGNLPRGTFRIELNDKSDTWIHVNSQNGEIVSVMDHSRRVYRWLYNGLHSLDFPGLVDQRPLWISIMTILLLSGLAFSITGTIVAFMHLRRM